LRAKTEREFAEYLSDAINNDYLVTILITSQTQAKVKSQNLPFGLGKTTLLLWLSYFLNNKNWETVFSYLCGNPYDVVNLLEPGTKRKNAAGWDAVQMTAPAEQGVPRVIRRMASYLSDTRPEIACLIMTGSNINAIAAPLRKLIVFEVIVAERGYYEIQKITYHKNYKAPLLDLSRLEYLEEGTFPKLPEDIYSRYEQWRVGSKAKIYPHLKLDVQGYMNLQKEKEGEDNQFDAPVIRAGGGYMVRVPTSLGEKLHHQVLEVTVKTK
jgi:hypothetical protein